MVTLIERIKYCRYIISPTTRQMIRASWKFYDQVHFIANIEVILTPHSFLGLNVLNAMYDDNSSVTQNYKN